MSVENIVTKFAIEYMEQEEENNLDEDAQGMYQVAIKALNKQIPTSRIIREGRYYCPICNRKIDIQGYCVGCGQKLY